MDRRYVGEAGLAALWELLGDGDVAHEVRRGIGSEVAAEMLRVVRETEAEVLVIGLRHRTPVGKMIMSSVAQAGVARSSLLGAGRQAASRVTTFAARQDARDSRALGEADLSQLGRPLARQPPGP